MVTMATAEGDVSLTQYIMYLIGVVTQHTAIPNTYNRVTHGRQKSLLGKNDELLIQNLG